MASTMAYEWWWANARYVTGWASSRARLAGSHTWNGIHLDSQLHRLRKEREKAVPQWTPGRWTNTRWNEWTHRSPLTGQSEDGAVLGDPYRNWRQACTSRAHVHHWPDRCIDNTNLVGQSSKRSPTSVAGYTRNPVSVLHSNLGREPRYSEEYAWDEADSLRRWAQLDWHQPHENEASFMDTGYVTGIEGPHAGPQDTQLGFQPQLEYAASYLHGTRAICQQPKDCNLHHPWTWATKLPTGTWSTLGTTSGRQMERHSPTRKPNEE